MGKIFKNPTLFFLLIIFILGAALRFYRLSEMTPFDFDQEYAANFAYRVINDYPIQLIGQGLSFEGLFLGPLYFYYLTPFYILTNLHPIGGAIGSVFLGLITIGVYFFTVKEIFGVRAGLVAAFFRAVLFSFIASDWAVTPAYSSDVIVVLTWLHFYKIWQGRLYFLPSLGLLFGFYTSFHPILLPFFLVFIALIFLRLGFFIQKKLFKPKYILLSFVAFIIPILPLLMFEYLRNFFDMKNLLVFKPASGTNIVTIETFFHYLRVVFTEPYHYLTSTLIPLESVLTTILIIVVILAVRGTGFWKDSFHKIMLPVSFVTFLLVFLRFPLRVPEYYFLGLYVLTIIYLAATISLLLKKRLLPIFILVIFIILSVNFYYLNQSWNNPKKITLYHKDQIVQKILETQGENQEFFVSFITELGWKNGYDYLFKYYKRLPQTKEAKPPIYTIVVPAKLVKDDLDFKSGDIGLILPK